MQSQSSMSGAATLAASGGKAIAVWPALLSAMLGVFLIWGVGFSHISAIHNAAHDTRHSNVFPCH
jgi:cobalt transporter subunit CbtB